MMHPDLPKTLAASLALEFPLLGVIHLLTAASAQALLSRRNEEPLPVGFPTSPSPGSCAGPGSVRLTLHLLIFSKPNDFIIRRN